MFDEFPIEEFETSQEVYTQYTGRRTKSGQPLYVYKVGALTKEKVNEYSKKADRLEPRMIVLSEVSCYCLLGLGEPEPIVSDFADDDGLRSSSVHGSTSPQHRDTYRLYRLQWVPALQPDAVFEAHHRSLAVVDVANVSLTRFWQLKVSLDVSGSILRIAHYPFYRVTCNAPRQWLPLTTPRLSERKVSPAVSVLSHKLTFSSHSHSIYLVGAPNL